MNNVLALTMESEAFTALKSDFKQVLRRTLANMERKESEQAELTLKLKISLEKDTAPDFREVRYRAERDIVRPTFTHKVSSVMQIKCEKSGILSGDYELVWDEDSGDYIMRPIDNGQISMLDDEGKVKEPILLEAGNSAEVVEAECDEVDIDDIEVDDYTYTEPDLEGLENEQ